MVPRFLHFDHLNFLHEGVLRNSDLTPWAKGR
jgi:hypothetical protein